MGLLPHQWWRMTPREFRLHAEGYQRRREHDLELLAWHAANIINFRTPALGEKHRKTITPDDLLGRKKRRVFRSAAEFRAHMRQRLEEAEEG